MRLAGCDGARGGWVVVLGDREGPTDAKYVLTLDEVLPEADLILVDIPIGLPSSGRREVDRVAKQMLPVSKKSCVFPVSNREVLSQPTYREANELAAQLGLTKISYQLFNLAPKIFEVDAILRAPSDPTPRIVETHPELGFFLMSGSVDGLPKKKLAEGKAVRREMIRNLWPSAPLWDLWVSVRSSPANEDDFLDACAAFWSAQRYDSGEAVQIPENPEMDDFGLPVRMVL